MENACEKRGIKINAAKCKVIGESVGQITIDNNAVENVEKFVFLGSVVPNSSDDVKRRIALASSAFGKLKKKIWGNRDLSYHIKLRLYSSLIVPIAIYASETWTLKAEDTRRLLVFENDCLRTMVGKTRRDRCKLVDIRKTLGIKCNIVDVIQKRRLNWFGHVVRRGGDSNVYRSYQESFPGKRPIGRPPKRWSDQIRKETGIPLKTLERTATDRDRWKKFVNKKCAKI